MKLTKLFVAACALFMSATAFAQTTINGLIYTLNNEGTEYTVTGKVDAELPNDVVILGDIEGIPVTTLASRLFQSNTNITSCVMPNSISKLLGDGEFNQCTNLRSVTLSNKLPKITNHMFDSTILEEITIPASVITIGTQALAAYNDASKASLKKVIFEDGSKLVSLGTQCFDNRNALAEVNLEACRSLTTLYARCFQNCSKLNPITIPASVSTIDGGYHFNNCTSLSTVTFENGCKISSIGEQMFNGCTNLQSVNLEACQSLTTLNARCFQNCSKLNPITIPASVSNISGEYHFNNCTSLSTVTFEPGCKISAIANRMFHNCSILPSITIPASVVSIGDEAFRYCKGIVSITIPASVKTLGQHIFRDGKLSSITFEEGSQLEIISWNALRWNYFTVLDLSGCHKLTTIRDAALEGCPNLQKVYLPENVKEFGNRCFSNNSNMQYVVMNYGGDWSGIAFNGANGNFSEGTGNYNIYVNANATGCPASIDGRTIVKVAPITISAAGYATYYNSNAIDLPSTLEAAYVEGVTDRMIDYNWAYASHNAVPAATGVVVRGAQGTYTPALVTTAAFAGTNLLNGSDEADTTVGGDKYYKLSLDADNTPGTLGFYWGEENGAAFQNGAHKAYLALTTAQAKSIKGFRFDGTYDEDSETTGITTLNPQPATNNQMYNLAGQRVNANAKGIVIVNGHKYIK